MEKGAGRTFTAKERRDILDVMINERLALQAAEKDRITLTDSELNQQIQQMRANLAQSVGRQPTDAEFALAIKNQTGLDLPVFREQMRRQMLVQKYLLSKKQSIIDAAKPPTDADILSAYNIAKSQFIRPDTVRFSMIMVPIGSASAEKTRARELANRLAQEIGSNPGKFDEVSVRAQAQNSGYRAGDGGYLPRNPQAQQVVGLDFLNAAFSLKQGEVSRLLESPNGYQIIKVTETYAQKNLELDDVFQLGSRMTVRNYIGTMLYQERQQAALEKASEELVKELRIGTPFQVFENNISW
jgi:parvulin-like peptidyl-prolyl isomerase